MQPLQLIQQSGPKPPYPSQPPMIRTASLDLGMQMPHTGIPPASFYATNDPTVRPSPPESSRVDYQTALYQQQQQQQQMQADPQNSMHMVGVLLLSHSLSLSKRLNVIFPCYARVMLPVQRCTYHAQVTRFPDGQLFQYGIVAAIQFWSTVFFTTVCLYWRQPHLDTLYDTQGSTVSLFYRSRRTCPEYRAMHSSFTGWFIWFVIFIFLAHFWFDSLVTY